MKDNGGLPGNELGRLVNGRIRNTLSNLRQQFKPDTLRVRGSKRWRSRGMRARNIADGSGVPRQHKPWTGKLSTWPSGITSAPRTRRTTGFSQRVLSAWKQDLLWRTRSRWSWKAGVDDDGKGRGQEREVGTVWIRLRSGIGPVTGHIRETDRPSRQPLELPSNPNSNLTFGQTEACRLSAMSQCWSG